MRAPAQIEQANPKRPGESIQGYTQRVLAYAQEEWILGTLDILIHKAELEVIGLAGDAEDAANNIMIVLHAERAFQEALLKTGKPKRL